jgi:hypothetical protein
VSFPEQVQNDNSDSNDFGVSLTERIKNRKRPVQSSEMNDKNDSFDKSNYGLMFIFELLL